MNNLCTALRSTLKLRFQMHEKETSYCVVYDSLPLIRILHCLIMAFQKNQNMLQYNL